ncbi:MAG TPA: hypothetical protein VH500_11020 [Nitrososphaeraceae archaeon]
MPSAIPETIKSRVISQWLQGLGRDIIAQDNNISTGAVSNITNEWSMDNGKHEADAFRELAKAMNTAGLTPARCAIGFRTINLLSGQNVDPEAATQLIMDIYNKCKDSGVLPSEFATCIKDLVKVSNDDHVPLSKIKEHIDEKTAKKKELDKELEQLKNKISTLSNQKSEIENARDLALQQKKMAESDIKSYTNAKQVLDRHKLSITEDLGKLVNIVSCIAAYGYDPKRVLEEFNNVQHLDGKKRALEETTNVVELNIAELSQRESLLQDKIYLHSETLPVYDELANLGFGSSELRTLRNLLVNIASSLGLYPPSVVKKFFEDLKTQYNTKLGFELQIENLKAEFQTINDKLEKGLQRLKDQSSIEPVLTTLLRMGLNEHDIVKVAEIYHGKLSNRTFYEEDLKKDVINALKNILLISMIYASRSCAQSPPVLINQQWQSKTQDLKKENINTIQYILLLISMIYASRSCAQSPPVLINQ